MSGLKKVNGKGAVNTCAKPKSSTIQVIVGNGTYVGKAAKRAAYVNGARSTWERYTQRGQAKATSCGDQKPSSIKTR